MLKKALKVSIWSMAKTCGKYSREYFFCHNLSMAVLHSVPCSRCHTLTAPIHLQWSLVHVLPNTHKKMIASLRSFWGCNLVHGKDMWPIFWGIFCHIIPVSGCLTLSSTLFNIGATLLQHPFISNGA